MQRLRPLIIDTGRNPYAVLLFAISVIAGAAGIVLPADRVRSTVLELLPRPAGLLWSAGLALGGLLALVAVLLLRLPYSLLLERVAAAILGGLLAGYSIAVVLVTWGQLPLGAINLVAGALASWWRVWHITRRDLPRLRAAVAALASNGGAS